MKAKGIAFIVFCLLLASGYMFANHCIRNLTSLIPRLAPAYISTTDLSIDRVEFKNASYVFASNARLENVTVKGSYLPREGVTRAQMFALHVESMLFSPRLFSPGAVDVELNALSFRFRGVDMLIDTIRLHVPRDAISDGRFLEVLRSFFLDLCLKMQLSYVEEIGRAQLSFSADAQPFTLEVVVGESGLRTLVVPEVVVKTYLEDASVGSTEAERREYASSGFYLPDFRRAKQVARDVARTEFPNEADKRAFLERSLWARELSLYSGKERAARIIQAAGASGTEIEKAGRRGLWLSGRMMSRSEAIRSSLN